MFKRFAALTLFSTVTVCMLAQGLDTRASKDDWEEINFEFNSAILSDGYPSLLRLAELLHNNPGYHVKIEGNTDNLGTSRYNEKLGLERAKTVGAFLIKYGAQPDQIEAVSHGKSNPKYPGYKHHYSKTDVARWMNRRVVLTVTDQNGRVVGAGGVGEAIKAMPQEPQQCCNEILKRLDKLDDIARMLKELTDQNAALQHEIDNLKAQQAALQAKVNGAPKPLTREETAQTVAKEIAKARPPRFAILGMNVGEDSFKNVTASASARYFAPFKEHFGIQAQGDYMYYRTQKEGQFDLGLVDRIGNFEAGAFGSFKHVDLSGYQSGGTLGQAAVTFDYLFKLGRVGLFGTKGFMNNALIDSRNATITNGVVGMNCDGAAPGTCSVAPNLYLEHYLSIVDQVGASTTLGLWGNNYLEADLGYLKSRAHADRPGGTIRFVFPISRRFAFTLEGGMNETLLDANNWGRAAVGFQMGNFMRPRDYQSSHEPVPAAVPQVRYEVVTKTVMKGASPPIADAGPDQIGVPAGTITLNGSGSYDPNGLALTYQWVEQGGPPVSVSGANQAMATFPAAADQSYVFQLTVRNTDGLSASARVRITTQANAQVQILFFISNPPTIQSGQASQLSWKVLNAQTVTISGIGTVAAEGTSSVSPAQTTTYTLTATNANGSQNATTTVVVVTPQPMISGCYATPANITAGESATVNFSTTNVSGVTVTPSVGNVPNSGNFVVSPTATTTYVIVGTGLAGQTVSCSVTVTVTATLAAPRIIRFTANPTNIIAGQTSTLVWQVENATTVTIDQGVGNQQGVGTQDVMPAQTTTYTLTASNSAGSVTATATVTVTQSAKITSFTANPPVSPAPGSSVVLTCLATNATSVTIAGAGTLVNGSVTVQPQVTTTYTCTAVGQGPADTKTLTVTVTQPGGGGGQSGPPPTVVIAGGPLIQTNVRTLQLDGSASSSPAGNTPLTYLWSSVNGRAAILDPTSPTPTIYLGNLAGDYYFTLAVTDSKGNKATATVDVQLTVTHVP
jgi:OmpA family/K319L-like, PKD domain